MAEKNGNRFTFTQSDHLPGVTALQAVMRDFSYEKHEHEEFAIGVTLSGRQIFSCRGSLFTSLPGNVILFHPGLVHDGRPGDASALRYAMLYIQPDRLFPLIQCVSRETAAPSRFRETVIADARLRDLTLGLAAMVAEARGSGLDQEMQLYAIAQRLAQRQGRFQSPGTAAGAAGLKDALYSRVRDYIMDNLDRELSIDELSAVVHLSKYHFIRMFRGQFGITPHRYALNCRINRARTALEQGRPPSETAQSFGFADVSHFNRRFKQVYGITPKQYQSQLLR